MQRSAGVLVFRRAAAGAQVLLGHMGGPFWARRHERAWTIPKGLIEAGESPEAAARREFLEETGLVLDAPLTPLTPIRASGKILLIWLAEADLDLANFSSNSFEMEWPPRSGRTISAPELDRIAYFGADEALGLMVVGQVPVLEAALSLLCPGPSS
jgi:predicted NUDIX family NTP pyrophosphohydrolase